MAKQYRYFVYFDSNPHIDLDLWREITDRTIAWFKDFNESAAHARKCANNYGGIAVIEDRNTIRIDINGNKTCFCYEIKPFMKGRVKK